MESCMLCEDTNNIKIHTLKSLCVKAKKRPCSQREQGLYSLLTIRNSLTLIMTSVDV